MTMNYGGRDDDKKKDGMPPQDQDLVIQSFDPIMIHLSLRG